MKYPPPAKKLDGGTPSTLSYGLKIPKISDAPLGLAGKVSTSESLPAKPGRWHEPFASTSSRRVKQAAKILAANGVTLKEGALYVVQIGQDNPPPTAKTIDRAVHMWDYTGELVPFTYQGGKLRALHDEILSAASHPGQTVVPAGMGVDVDGDGRSDVAYLRTGVYQYHAVARTWGNYPGSFGPADEGAMIVARDINHDATISESESATTREHPAGSRAGALLIHPGPPSQVKSLGCQSLPEQDFERLGSVVEAWLSRSDELQFTYVLVRRPNDESGANPW